MLNWINRFSIFCFLDNHQYQLAPHSYECLAAAGARASFRADAGDALERLQAFIQQRPDAWLFGHLGYDLKNETEALRSDHPDHVGFPDLFFFEPEVLVRLSAGTLEIRAEDPRAVYKAMLAAPALPVHAAINTVTHSRFSKEEYVETVRRLLAHMARGDCYEVNFCQEFFAENCRIDPPAVYHRLSRVSPNPFSALYRLGDRWLIGASPERFLRRTGDRLLSQPIKGTTKRFPADAVADEASRAELHRSAKDRSENVMVVDLVRNDLSRVCREGSVNVEELFGVYAFPQVYQMISTVTGELKQGMRFADIIRATFPMGSMTGAPKKRVMQLIEQYEKTKRGLFSGALGYIAPGGDFDFNVVIRSILYNEASGYLSYQAGSGITVYSDPEKEWEECGMKAAAIREVLG